MIEHFGEEVQAIRGVWRRGPHTLVSTNIDKVNELTAKGLDLGEAIQYAWTVTRARKLGFNRVTVLGQPVGNPGAYSAIDVLLEKTGIE